MSAAAHHDHGPYLIFLGDITEPAYAKTALGLRDWANDRCVGELGLGSSVSVGLPKLSPAEARARGARALLIGVATPGGLIPEHWLPSLMDALTAGLDIVSGMHAKLSGVPSIEEVISQTVALGRLTNPSIRCVGASLNTAHLPTEAALELIDFEAGRLNRPVADPMRGGAAFERLLDACES